LLPTAVLAKANKPCGSLEIQQLGKHEFVIMDITIFMALPVVLRRRVPTVNKGSEVRPFHSLRGV
jgi:hypothetical protein